MSDVFSSLQYVVAPMVSQSDAPFRALCLKYGATVAYTEMFYSDKVVNDPEYLDAYLPQADHLLGSETHCTRPLIVQVCGNDPAILAQAVVIIATSNRGVDAIDLNLGCPQDRARDGLFGSFLLDKCHWERVYACVKACSDSLAQHNVPMFCKIRLIEGGDAVELTTQFCRGLIQSGAKAICIHGRTRGSTKKRRCGPADLAAIGAIARILHTEFNGTIPVISNGNITTPRDAIVARQEANPCVGVMSAEGILADPAVFFGLPRDLPSSITLSATMSTECVIVPSSSSTPEEMDKIETTILSHVAGNRAMKPSLLALFREYCELSVLYQQHGGWEKLDIHYTRNYLKNKDPALVIDYVVESRQIYIARQHLAWMLGKSGHGRMVRYTYIGACYKKHVHLMQALAEAASIDDLLNIAEKCLPGQLYIIERCFIRHVYTNSDKILITNKTYVQ